MILNTVNRFVEGLQLYNMTKKNKQSLGKIITTIVLFQFRLLSVIKPTATDISCPNSNGNHLDHY